MRGIRDRVAALLLVDCDELRFSIHDHFGRIDSPFFELRDITLLPVGPFTLGKRVNPTFVVEVVNMFFERDHLCVCDRLLTLESHEKIVRGRARRATFRSEKLDDYGTASSHVRRGLRFESSRRARIQSQEQDRSNNRN